MSPGSPNTHHTNLLIRLRFSHVSSPPRLHAGGVSSSSVKLVLCFVGETFYPETGQSSSMIKTKHNKTKQRTTSPRSVFTSACLSQRALHLHLVGIWGSAAEWSDRLFYCYLQSWSCFYFTAAAGCAKINENASFQFEYCCVCEQVVPPFAN